MAKKLYEEEKIRAIAERIKALSGDSTPRTTAEMPDGVSLVGMARFASGFDEGQQYVKTSEARTAADITGKVNSQIEAGVNVKGGYYAKDTYITIDIEDVYDSGYDEGYSDGYNAAGGSGGGGGSIEYSEGLEFMNYYGEEGYYVYQGSCSDSFIKIPPEYNGMPVIGLGDFGFQVGEPFDSIYIPATVVEGMYEALPGGITVYCEAEEQPDGWYPDWNWLGNTVIWGYKLGGSGGGDWQEGYDEGWQDGYDEGWRQTEGELYPLIEQSLADYVIRNDNNDYYFSVDAFGMYGGLCFDDLLEIETSSIQSNPLTISVINHSSLSAKLYVYAYDMANECTFEDYIDVWPDSSNSLDFMSDEAFGNPPEWEYQILGVRFIKDVI